MRTLKFAEYFDKFDEYCRLQEELAKEMKDGFFEMISIRRSDSRMSDFCFPTYIPNLKIPPCTVLSRSEKGVFELKANDNVVDVVDTIKVESTLRQRKGKDVEKIEKEQQSENKEIPQTKDQLPQVSGILTKTKETELQKLDPIYWYSLMPPEGLIKAQTSFKKALIASVKLANLIQEMNHLVNEWNKLQ